MVCTRLRHIRLSSTTRSSLPELVPVAGTAQGIFEETGPHVLHIIFRIVHDMHHDTSLIPNEVKQLPTAVVFSFSLIAAEWLETV